MNRKSGDPEAAFGAPRRSRQSRRPAAPGGDCARATRRRGQLRLAQPEAHRFGFDANAEPSVGESRRAAGIRNRTCGRSHLTLAEDLDRNRRLTARSTLRTGHDEARPAGPLDRRPHRRYSNHAAGPRRRRIRRSGDRRAVPVTAIRLRVICNLGAYLTRRHRRRRW